MATRKRENKKHTESSVRFKKKLPKLSDAERHVRFVDTARKVEASEDPAEFEKAFKKLVTPKRPYKSD
jgi:hypothetical protein